MIHFIFLIFCFSATACAAPCQNGGQCQLISNSSYACVCPADYAGAQCETLVTTPVITITMTTTTTTITTMTTTTAMITTATVTFTTTSSSGSSKIDLYLYIDL